MRLTRETATKEEKQKQQKDYNDYVKQVTPTHSLVGNMLKAFLVGGIICVIGQVILNIAGNMDLDKETAGSWTSLILVFISVILTGLNIYPSIANWGGAGALVPITGFANSVEAPAIEYQTHGQVFGIGRACDPVRDIYQLGAGADLLGDEDAGLGVNERELAQ